MNNQEVLNRISEEFKNLSAKDFAEWTVKFFHTNGATTLLRHNKKQTMLAAEACVMKAVTDLSLGKVSSKNLPSYTALLGIASGVAFGLYIIAKSLGMEEQFIQDSPVTEEEIKETFAHVKEKYKDIKEVITGINPLDDELSKMN